MSISSPENEVNYQLRSQSLPLPTIEHSGQLKPQTSAPHYLFSFKENNLPPFQKPGPEPRAQLLIGTFMTAQNVVDMVTEAAMHDNHVEKHLTKILIEKKFLLNYEVSETRFLQSFLMEAISYAAVRDFSAAKLSCLLTLYVNAHCYFKWYYWLPPMSLWCYFKEILIRHSVDDSPDGQAVFEPEEAYDILTHFHSIYMMNLPLIHILTFGVFQLKYTWPFNKK